MTDHSKLQPYADAWTHSTDAISELVAPLVEGEWNRATPCPGWSVRDVVSHVIGLECEMLGDPRPIHTLPRDLYHVTNEFARYNETPVDTRRCHTAPEMTSELEYTLIRRARQLRNEKRGPEDMVRGPMGREMTLAELWWTRAFDVWVHEQDLRWALGEPGGLDSPGAVAARDFLLRAMPKVIAKDAGAPPGAAVVLDVNGPLEFMRTIRIDAQGRGTMDASVSLGPTLTLTMDWETYARLCTGRLKPGAAGDRVLAEGDQDLAAAVLANLNITP